MHNKANKVFANIETALKKNDIQQVTALQSEYNSINKQITHKLNMQLNDWAFHKSKVLDSDQKNMEIQINKLNATLAAKLSKPMHNKEVNEVLMILQQVEKLTRELVWMGYALPQRLLAVQMNEVGIYDTYLAQYKHPETEDALYKRIIDDADRLGILEPVAEMMRMNYANSLSKIEDAAQNYKQAITNLQKVSNKSKIVWHNITDVYMHLCNLYEALQLEGTIYYALWEITHGELMFNKSIECLLKCWNWNIRHPQNHYQDAFKIHSGRILKIHGLIE